MVVPLVSDPVGEETIVKLYGKTEVFGGRLLLAICALVLGSVIWGCSSSDYDAIAVGPDGTRLTNAEVMFITRGSLEGEIAPNG